MHRVFISYRRAESEEAAGRVYDYLISHFGKDRVFRDVDTIAPGRDFRKEIRRHISGSDVVLVVIGPKWASLVDDVGTQRIAGPDDFVRIEVEQALVCGAWMIPVLVNGATVPKPSELPESVRQVCYLNAIHVRRDPDFSGDMRKLARQIMEGTASGWHLIRAGGISALAGAVLLSCNLLWFAACFLPRGGGAATKMFTAWRSPFTLFRLELTGHLMMLSIVALAAISWPRRFVTQKTYLMIAATLLFLCMAYVTFPIALDLLTPAYNEGVDLVKERIDRFGIGGGKGPQLYFSTGDGPPLAAGAIAGIALLVWKQASLPLRSRRRLRWVFAALALIAVFLGSAYASLIAIAFNGAVKLVGAIAGFAILVTVMALVVGANVLQVGAVAFIRMVSFIARWWKNTGYDACFLDIIRNYSRILNDMLHCLNNWLDQEVK